SRRRRTRGARTSVDAFAECVGAQDDYLAAFPADQALVLKEAQPDVQGLAGGTDNAGQVVLGHPRRAGWIARGALGQLENVDRESGRDVEERGFLNDLRVAPQPTAEHSQQSDRVVAVFAQELLEVVADDVQNLGGLDGDRVGGARFAVEERELAEEVGGTEEV